MARIRKKKSYEQHATAAIVVFSVIMATFIAMGVLTPWVIGVIGVAFLVIVVLFIHDVLTTDRTQLTETGSDEKAAHAPDCPGL